jgi:GH25 family lysozyme M1 (1,4-beta-N-acetylmuramidase)
MDYGIDISNYQGPSIDWAQVKGNGIQFAMVELGDGIDFENPYMQQQIDGARSVGIVTGGYHFARPVDVNSQVTLFVNRLHARGLLDRGSLYPMLDIEAGGLTGDFVHQFEQDFHSLTDVPLVVYATTDYFTHVLHAERWLNDKVLLELAEWNGDPGNISHYLHPKVALHQHTNQGVIPGITGYVDRVETVNGYSLANLTIGADMSGMVEIWKNQSTGDVARLFENGVMTSIAGSDYENAVNAGQCIIITVPDSVWQDQAGKSDRIVKGNLVTR